MEGQAYAITVLLLVLLEGTSSETQCPANIGTVRLTKQRNGVCYVIHQTRKTWNKARDDCHSKGGYLAEVPDNATQNFLLASLSSLSWQRHGVWIGATDSETEGQWVWEGKGLPLTYTNWAPGQAAPRSNQNGFLFRSGDVMSNENDDCAQIRLLNSGRWYDYPCNNGTFSYICQYDSVAFLRSATAGRSATTPRSRPRTRQRHITTRPTATSTTSLTSRRPLTTVRPVATSRASSAISAASTTVRHRHRTRFAVPSSTKQTPGTSATISSRSFTTPQTSSARSSVAPKKVTYSSTTSLTSATTTHKLSTATSPATLLPSRKSAPNLSPTSRATGPIPSNRTLTVWADSTRAGSTTQRVSVNVTATSAVFTRSRSDRAVSSSRAPTSSGGARSHVTSRATSSPPSTAAHGPRRTRRTFEPPPLPHNIHPNLPRSSLHRDVGDSQHKTSPGVIAGIVLGSIAGLLALAVVAFFVRSHIKGIKVRSPTHKLKLAFENLLYAPT